MVPIKNATQLEYDCFLWRIPRRMCLLIKILIDIYKFFTLYVCLVSMPNGDKGRYFLHLATVSMLVFNTRDATEMHGFFRCCCCIRADAHLIRNEFSNFDKIHRSGFPKFESALNIFLCPFFSLFDIRSRSFAHFSLRWLKLSPSREFVGWASKFPLKLKTSAECSFELAPVDRHKI